MVSPVDPARPMAVASAHKELAYKWRALKATVRRLGLGTHSLDLRIEDGRVVEIRPASGEADLVIPRPGRLPGGWAAQPVPRPGYGPLTMGLAQSFSFQGDFTRLVRPIRAPGVRYLEAEGPGHFASSDDPLAFRALILPILDHLLAKVERPTRAGSPTP